MAAVIGHALIHAPRPAVHASAERWIGVGFAIGSLCFFIGPFPGFLQIVGAQADAWVFFVGSIFFTLAAGTELWRASTDGRERDENWWSAAVQFAGTLLFNLSTGDVLRSDLSTHQEDRLVWAPDLFGSACFLVSGVLAYRAANVASRAMAAVNLRGLRTLRRGGHRLLHRPGHRLDPRPRRRELDHRGRRRLLLRGLAHAPTTQARPQRGVIHVD